MVKVASLVSSSKTEDGWAAGLKLAQMGEFSFIILALALENQLIGDLDSSVLVCIALISMGVTPWLINRSGPIAAKLSGNKLHTRLQAQEQIITSMSDHIVILGFGRVGQSMARMLKLEALPYIVVDSDPIRVEESRTAGESIIYGDVGQRDILKSANIASAKVAIVTFDDHEKALRVINVVNQVNEDVTVIVRTRKDYDMQDLYDAGAKQVVPEVQEGSLMLISQVLHYSGVPMSRILKRIRNERKDRYQHMHGFFPGETTEITAETTDKLEFMHAVVLSEDAYAVGRSLEELKLTRKNVKVIALRRKGKEFENPSPDMQIQAQDVVVITAKPRRMERIEKYLLDGS
jgi:CPA2 family monovalent cation:H+ antiporter-2